jgi:predicted CoA-binding protein
MVVNTYIRERKQPSYSVFRGIMDRGYNVLRYNFVYGQNVLKEDCYMSHNQIMLCYVIKCLILIIII